MHYVKGFLFSLAVTLGVVVAFSVIVIIVLIVKGRGLPPGQALTWDPMALFSSIPACILLFMVFILTFVWRLRHG
jgi:hypothetical protein